MTLKSHQTLSVNFITIMQVCPKTYRFIVHIQISLIMTIQERIGKRITQLRKEKKTVTTKVCIRSRHRKKFSYPH
jgi:hypothetical protein